MAVIQTKTFTGTTGNNNWSWKIIVTEETGSVANKTSPVKVEAYLGRPNSASYFYGYATITYRAGSQIYTQNFNASSQINVPAGGWYKMGEYTFNVSNTGTSANPTVITLSANMSGASFSPNTANASGSITLAVLHEAPLINPATIVETNQDMIDLGVPDTTIVPWLSEKTITLDAEAFDGATLEYRIRHGRSDYYLPSADTFQASNIFNANYRNNYVAVVNGKAPIVQIIHDSKGAQSSDMLLVEINGVVQQPDAIPYEKPTLEKTSTTIKRKSGSGTNLTDNKANVNVKGLIYKANDVIGNNNSTKYVGYKIWERETSEPLNYTSLTATTDNDGNVAVTDFEISNIDFTKAYTYKIIITDDYDYSYEIEDTVPTGQPTWTEYKDRVDFLNITRQGDEIYPNVYSTSEEIIVGKWIDDKPIYRKVFTGAITSTREEIDVSSLSVETPVKIWALINYNTLNNSWILSGFWSDATSYFNSYIANNNLVLTNAGFTNHDYIIVFEYTKTNN